ncbi:GGDEF domain-containing protein [Lysobacter bugurensis]|uniref:diguanylate cyclase n=2 Tax=Cognatilysobacter bugurensis TaxID=543356 RepID=A0A918T0M5_9GAMM|nr:GGDEF domain-containing protein [Lysobacter bugurensis]
MSLQRLRTDFSFAVLVLTGTCLVVAVVPFALYRAMVGPVAVAMLDSAIIAVVLGAIVRVWRGGAVEPAARLVSVALGAGVLGTVALVGPLAAPWLYPYVLAVFLLTGRRWAIALSAITLAALLLMPGAYESAVQAAVHTTTGALSAAFAYVFAQRAGLQHAHLHRLATHDALTGALNRRSLGQELERAIDAARSDAGTASLIVLDLDRFKHINDTHGHEAGDRVLIEFAHAVRDVTRRTDRFFRLGGEEFLLVLPGADATALARLCEALRDATRTRLEVGGEPVTVSIGAAVLQPDETAREWLVRADRAMYRAKRAGRDRAVIDQPAPATG